MPRERCLSVEKLEFGDSGPQIGKHLPGLPAGWAQAERQPRHAARFARFAWLVGARFVPLDELKWTHEACRWQGEWGTRG